MTTISESSGDEIKRDSNSAARPLTARERRLVRVYCLLLLVPLILGGSFLLWGRTDREAVRGEVRRGVAPVETAYQQVRPALSAARALDTVLPGVREAVQRLDQQAAQLVTLSGQQDTLTAQIRLLGLTFERYDSSLGRLQTIQESLPRLREALTMVANQQQSLRDSLRVARNLLTQLGAQLQKQNDQITIPGGQSVFRRQVDHLDLIDTLRLIDSAGVRHP